MGTTEETNVGGKKDEKEKKFGRIGLAIYVLRFDSGDFGDFDDFDGRARVLIFRLGF